MARIAPVLRVERDDGAALVAQRLVGGLLRLGLMVSSRLAPLRLACR